MKKKIIHLICNAHLDPVWLWQWQEGLTESLSTFRTAAELCERNDTFVFNHNEALLYKWIQEYDPQLFKTIQKLVRQKKWHIMGGWYLQPDCNMPSGESLVRQIQAGKSYFKKHFNVEPTTAINFDSFGHTRGLVQIMAKCGYDSYLFGRPSQESCPLPQDEFIWVGHDNSEIMATRFCGWYNSDLGKAKEKVEEWINDFGHKNNCICLWGVGNHGGGPSRIDIKNINTLISRQTDFDITHSTPERYFKELKKSKSTLPRFAQSLNYWAIGCYSSQIRLKQKHRQLENELFSTEKMATAAWVHNLLPYPTKELNSIQEDLLLSEFHDILPGSAVEKAYEASLRLLDHGIETASRIKTRLFVTLANGQPKAKPNTTPILVYNPHPFSVRQIIECEFNLPGHNPPGSDTQITVMGGRKVLPSQSEKDSTNLSTEWRKKVVFLADLLPSQMNRFDCLLGKTKKALPLKLMSKNNIYRFKTNDIEVKINCKTGLIDCYKVDGVNYLKNSSFKPIVLADNEDPWDMLNPTRSYKTIESKFKLLGKREGTRFSGIRGGLIDSVRMVEDGPVRTVIEAVFGHDHSFICLHYKLPKKGTEIEIEARVHWNQKNQLLKLAIPTTIKNAQYIGQTAYGIANLTTDGTELVTHKWTAVVDRTSDMALTWANNGVYSSDCANNTLHQTLLRSPQYSCAPSFDNDYVLTKDRYRPRTDQGEHVFNFWLNAGPASKRLEHIGREALVKNETPYTLPLFPSGAGKKVKPFAVLSDKIVQITAIKKAENSSDVIIRLFEPTGQKRITTLSLPCISKKIKIDFGAFELKTIRVNLKTEKLSETSLLEEP